MYERQRGLAVYRHQGKGPQVVLIHGAMDRAAGMLRIARRLKGHAIVRYDRRGYGRSGSAPPMASFDDQVEDLATVIGGRASIVFGHSYGGVIALALAQQGNVPIDAVVVYETPRAWEAWWPPPAGEGLPAADAAEQLVRALAGDAAWETMPGAAQRARRAEGEALMAELRAQRTRRFDASLLAVPLTVGVGSASGERTQRAARLTASEASHGRLRIVEGAAHAAPMTHPSSIAALIREWLP